MEETVRMVQSAAQAGVEITAELLKILAPALARGGMKLLGAGGKLIGYGIDKAKDAIAFSNAEGTVSRKHLFSEALKANTEVKRTDSFPSEAVERMMEMAKKYKIPISVNGDGASRSISYLARDRDTIAQIMQDWQMERLAPKGEKQSVIMFAVNDSRNLSSIKSCFEQSGIECWFTQNKNGDIRCCIRTSDSEKAKLVIEDFKNTQDNVEKNFKITPNVPENEKMKDIKMQIGNLENSLSNIEARAAYYQEMATDESIGYPTFSVKNMERVYEQMPDATKVAGKAFWEQQGLKLNVDAKGIEIIAPQMDDNGKPVLDDNGKTVFTTTTVYDISETNAYEKNVQSKIDNLQAEFNSEKAKVFAASENKSVVVSDTNGNSVEIAADNNLRKSDAVNILCDELGYTPLQAELAANRLGADLGLGDNYYAPHTQAENIERLQVNIRYASDDRTIQDVGFSAVKLKAEDSVLLSVSSGDKAVLIAPDKLSDSEMRTAFKEQLGMSDIQAEKAIEKSRKIDRQIQNKLRETVYNRDESQSSVNIERTSADAFIVKCGEKIKSYTFDQINVEKRIAEDFGIPQNNAHNVIQKAKSQSVVQNKIRANAENKRKSDKVKNDPLKAAQNIGTKKVMR